jgi:hypothetical protein
MAFILPLCGPDNFASRAFADGPEYGGRQGRIHDHRGFRPDCDGPPPAAEPICASAPERPCAPCFRTERRTVLVPQMVTETREIPTTEIRPEEREREVIVHRRVPETVQRTRTFTVMEPQVRSHEETYTVRKPVTKCVEQSYTVDVPYTETKTGTRTVCKPIWKDVPHDVCVRVPYTEKRTAMRAVCRSVPVTRTRTVCIDEGHWCVRTVCRPCKPCDPCAPAPVVACKTRVWVPEFVKKEQCYTVDEMQTVQVPYEYDVTLCRTETQTRTDRVREMVPTQETYQYQVCLTRPETRTRTVQVCDYVSEQKTRIVNEKVCVPCQKTETYDETVWHCVAEKRIQKQTVCVPVCTTREVQVRVCRLVPKTVDVKVAAAPVCRVRTSNECVRFGPRD